MCLISSSENASFQAFVLYLFFFFLHFVCILLDSLIILLIRLHYTHIYEQVFNNLVLV